jgi:phosphonoacetaldehyde hydrolase
VKHLEAVIFDWAGTTVDCGSLAPVRAVTRLFESRAIQVSDADVRRDMGLFKKDHVRRILTLPHVDQEWRKQKGRPASEEDVEALFVEFCSLQMEILAEHSQLIEGIAGLAQRLRARDLKLGSTTGYTRPMLQLLEECAGKQGYRPDLALCPDDVGGGRPHPWMCLRIALDFRLTSMAAAVKVGDTASDIHEGLNAGLWTVGVTATGNEVGLSAAQLAALKPGDYSHCVNIARDKLIGAGAHFVIDNATELEPILEQIDHRLAAGERP